MNLDDFFANAFFQINSQNFKNSLSVVSQVCKTFYETNVESGFDETQSLHLTGIYLSMLLQMTQTDSNAIQGDDNNA